MGRFRLSNREMAAHKELRKKLILAKKQKQNRPVPNWVRYRTGNTIKYNAKRRHWRRTKNKIDQSQTGSDTVLVTPSSTTPRDVTGEEPRSVCKSLADPNVHLHYFLNYFFWLFCLM